MIIPNRVHTKKLAKADHPGQWAEARLLLFQHRIARLTSGEAKPRYRSCRAGSTICTAGSGDSLLASPPKFPSEQAA